jgi:hypothetical protein
MQNCIFFRDPVLVCDVFGSGREVASTLHGAFWWAGCAGCEDYEGGGVYVWDGI